MGIDSQISPHPDRLATPEPETPAANRPEMEPPLTPPTVERNWPMTVAAVLFSPFAFASAAINLGAEALERRFLGGRPGADNTESASERMSVEVTTVIGVFAGGLSGVLLAKALDPAPGVDGSWSPVWLAMTVGLMIGVIGLYRWIRRQVHVAKTGVWEPGVAPDIAMKSLRDLSRREIIRTIWPGAAALALEGRSGFWELVRADVWSVVWRTFLWCVPVAAWFTTSSSKWLTAALLLAVAAINFAGVSLSLAREHSRVSYRARMMQARFRTLRRRMGEPRKPSPDQKVTQIQQSLDAVLAGQERLQHQLNELLARASIVSAPQGEAGSRRAGWARRRHIWMGFRFRM